MRKVFLTVILGLFFSLPCMAADLQEITQPKLASLINQNSGKVIILNFFATWCPPCRVEIPELVKIRDAFPADQVEIIGLSVDEDKNAVPEFLKNIGVNYPVYLAAGDVTGSYDISSVPHNVLYASNGKMVISEAGLIEKDLFTEIITDLLKAK